MIVDFGARMIYEPNLNKFYKYLKIYNFPQKNTILNQIMHNKYFMIINKEQMSSLY